MSDDPQSVRVGEIIDIPCPQCFERALLPTVRLEATKAGRELRFSIPGAQMKLPVQSWPYLVCQTPGCGFEVRAT